jgi:hypothetical protein
MARRQGSMSSPKSAQRGKKKTSSTPPVDTDLSGPGCRKKKQRTQQVDPGSEQPIRTSESSAIPVHSLDQQGERSASSMKGRTPPSIALVQLEPPRAPNHGLGTGKRIRTPPPVPGNAQETRAVVRQTQPSQFPRFRGTGRRIRTPQPESIAAQPEKKNVGPVQQKLSEKAQRFQHIQDLINNTTPFTLRSTEINTSSTPEEIKSRKAEVQYQIEIMKSVLAVLTEELNDLEQARPTVNANKQV